MRTALVGLSVLVMGLAALASVGCTSEHESELVWQATAPLTPDPDVAAPPGELAWKVDLQLEPPVGVKKDSKDRTTYAALVRFPHPIATELEVTSAVMELVPEVAERRGPPLDVAGKETYLKRTLRASAVSRITVRFTTKGGESALPTGPVTFSIGGAECITRQADEWQASQFGVEPVPLAGSSECVPR